MATPTYSTKPNSPSLFIHPHLGSFFNLLLILLMADFLSLISLYLAIKASLALLAAHLVQYHGQLTNHQSWRRSCHLYLEKNGVEGRMKCGSSGRGDQGVRVVESEKGQAIIFVISYMTRK